MDSRTPKSSESAGRKKLACITLALSPENNYKKTANKLPKLITSSKTKNTLKLPYDGSPKSTYSVAYIGDISGILSISVKKTVIPKLSRREISGGARARGFSPTDLVEPSFERKNHQYFRPKPLTPASIKMFDFSDYRHKSTSVYKAVRSNIRCKNESFDTHL